MKVAVVYRSKTGFAKQYAEWIAAELNADLFEASKVAIDRLKPYDVVVYGAGLYAVGINGVKLITGNMDKLAGKKLIVFATGASPGRPEEVAGVIDNNFSTEQQQRIRFFYLRGGFDASKLSAVDRVLMMLLKWKLKWKERRTGKLHPDERGMLNAYSRPVNFARKDNIALLVEYARSK